MKRKYSDEEEEVWWWDGDDWRHQMKRYGWVEWPEDHEMDIATFVAEHRWGWKWKNYVPSRLWDKETPSCVIG